MKGKLKYHATPCCALCQLTADNDTPFETLEAAVNEIKENSLNNVFHWSLRNGGERAIYVIACPGEEPLEENLKKLGFVHLTTFNRRKGYPPGQNKMYFLSF